MVNWQKVTHTQGWNEQIFFVYWVASMDEMNYSLLMTLLKRRWRLQHFSTTYINTYTVSSCSPNKPNQLSHENNLNCSNKLFLLVFHFNIINDIIDFIRLKNVSIFNWFRTVNILKIQFYDPIGLVYWNRGIQCCSTLSLSKRWSHNAFKSSRTNEEFFVMVLSFLPWC